MWATGPREVSYTGHWSFTLQSDTGPPYTDLWFDFVAGHWASGDGRVGSNSLSYGSAYFGSTVWEPGFQSGLIAPRDAKARRRTSMKYVG